MVSDIVREKALLRPGGEHWLRDLPHLVDELTAAWNLTPGAVLQGGTESYVFAATTGEGDDVVVKIELPGDESFAARMRVFAAAKGEGYARLLRYDEERGALVLERLGEPLSAAGLPVRRQIEILCELLQCAWQVPPDSALPRAVNKAQRLAAFVSAAWQELHQPCSERVVEQALAFAAARAAAHDDDHSVVLHGDAHPYNALRASDGYRFVDPESFLGDRAYDLGVLMREWSDELLAGDALGLGHARCDLLAELGGADRRAIWEWGFVERVSTGLFCLQVGAESMGRPVLAVAERWV